MSNLSVIARTNVFRVRNLDILLNILQHYDVRVEKEVVDGQQAIIIFAKTDTGEFPTHLRVSDEMYAFAIGATESLAADFDIASMTDEQLLDELHRRVEIEGMIASSEDLETISTIVRAENPDDIELDFGALVAPYIEDGEVMVMYAVGYDGSQRMPRSVFAFSRAFINTGEYVEVDLYDLEDRARERFGILPRRIGN